MYELTIEELEGVNGGNAQASTQTIQDFPGKGSLVVSTTTYYGSYGSYTVTTAGWIK